MLQLKELLSDRGKLVVEFNAWRHDKADELWAAFALDFLRQLSEKQSFHRRWSASLKLRFRRYDWTQGAFEVFRASSVLVLLLSAAVTVGVLLLTRGTRWATQFSEQIVQGMGDEQDLWQSIVKVFINLGSAAAIIAMVVSAWPKLKQLLGNPIMAGLKKHIRSPDYDARVTFIERFHRDLNRIISSYVRKRRVYVFIDDLDRCEVPKAAELMQAINLMITNDPLLVFVIGMDREKVAAGLAVKYEKLLPYLRSDRDSQPPSSAAPIRQDGTYDLSTDASTGLEFGYSFIEKFVQLPFRVPQPSKCEVEKLLTTLMSTPKTRPSPGFFSRVFRRQVQSEDLSEVETGLLQLQGQEGDDERAVQRQPVLKLISGEQETETVRSIAMMIAPTLDYNPRRIKQFINIFRLKAHIAFETGLFDEIKSPTPDKALTLEQLGKFVALTQMYPRLLDDLDSNRELLQELENVAIKGMNSVTRMSTVVTHWNSKKRVMDLIGHGLTGESGSNYSLSALNVDKLLQISPRIARSDVNGGQAQAILR